VPMYETFHLERNKETAGRLYLYGPFYMWLLGVYMFSVSYDVWRKNSITIKFIIVLPFLFLYGIPGLMGFAAGFVLLLRVFRLK
jgi:hypothetical protein